MWREREGALGGAPGREHGVPPRRLSIGTDQGGRGRGGQENGVASGGVGLKNDFEVN